MCQSKAQGGKRCLAHHPLTMFLKRAISVKTGASPELVSQTLSELNKEGKNSPAPDVEDVNNFIDVKKFATEMDSDLSEHEKKIQLNQLEKARHEVEKNGVSGGAWYAWKNLMKRVVEKLKQFKKAALAVGLSGLLAFSLSACGGSINKPTDAPTPTTTSSQPAVQAFGSSIGETNADGSPVLVKDQYGEYQPTTLDPNSKLNTTVDPSVVGANVKSDGWTDEDVLSAQKWTGNFVASQVLDSTAMDTGQAGWDSYWSANSSKYLAPEWSQSMLTSSKKGLITNNIKSDIVFPMIRNGKPRIEKSDVTVTSISSMDAVSPSTGKWLLVSGNANASYKAANKDILSGYIAKGYTKEDVLAKFPSLKDESGTSTISNKFTYKYALEKGNGSWLITGYDNSFNVEFSK